MKPKAPHTPKPKTPKPLRGSIKHDVIHPADYLKYNFPISCEECSHYNSTEKSCTLGYNPKWHLHEYQSKTYELSGKVALCRFMEID
jgi:hypothetical protein